MRLYDLYNNTESWDQNLPTNLVPPIRHLRETFDEHHWKYGQITEKLCYWQLHPEEPEEDIKEYLVPLLQLKVQIVGASATHRFDELLNTKTAPAFFKAFFDLYLDGMRASALSIFLQLVPVGKANEQLLGVPHLEWAEAQVKNMVRSNIHLIGNWIRNVCDKQPYDSEDLEEQIWWRKWQAPMLIVMKPSRNKPYEPARIWERFDAERSQSLLEGFAEHYVVHVETRLEKVAGQAAVELAKQPVPQPKPAAEVPSQQEQSPRAMPQAQKPNTRRESRRKATQAKYKSWQIEYKSLKKSHSGHSDVWYSRKISRIPVAKGSSPETIRKHMNPK